MVAERDRAVARLLGQAGLVPLTGRRVLDVGCGFGHELAGMCRLGARAEDLVGVDLVPERVERARHSFPTIDFRVGSAVALGLDDASVDVVLCYTLFSSILDRPTAGRVAAEIDRVLRPGGAVAWYDLRYPSVQNRNVRAVRADEVRAMFPGLRASLSSVTLIPPLARRLGSLTPTAYPVLARLAPLRSHLVGALVKPSPSESSPSA
ncbi:MAG TPA: class I SAM-dependent methyltransferase [Candidatus Dormibacteraeota bacterium]|nr:class I SAM-dependent methyltransferase [Candidatus Dormibacteraeota bacterium]